MIALPDPRTNRDKEPAVSPLAGKQLLRDVYLAFIRIHILHHAAEARIFGVEIMEELKRHGYDIGPGTLYPLLHALENGGVLSSTQQVVAGKGRRYYRTTRTGDALLRELRAKLRELIGEVMEPRARARKLEGERARSVPAKRS
jgi:PadR family transcriptional regulator, regulatory protein PadR